MKFQIMMKILFTLLKKRKASAAELAAQNDVSERSIYRYVEELIISGVPLDIIRGRNGGIFLPDTYRLPENFFTREEYAAAVNALSALYDQLRDENVLHALEKISQGQKRSSRDLTLSGNILVDSGTWGDAYDFSEKLKVFEYATETCQCLEILYIDRSGSESRRTIEPHLLIYKQNIWYIYAWCRTRKNFRLFRIGRVRSARILEETFPKREINREQLPLKFDFVNTELIEVKLSVQKKALPDVEEWLGIGNVHPSNSGLIAEATLPAGEVLISKLLSFGDGIRILSPTSLADTVRERAESLLKLYS